MKLVIGDPSNIKGTMVKMGNHCFPNIGILYIFGYLRENLKDLNLYYLRGDLDLDSYIKRLEEIKPDVFGISFASWVSDIAFQTISAVRNRFPNLPIICGGTHPTSCYNDVLNNSSADICVIGEGEVTTLELIEYYQLKNPPLSEIKGIAYRENSSIRVNSNRPHIQDLGQIPLPAWDLIDFNEYEGLSYCKARPNTAAIFSRGCPYNCSYCSNPVWRSAKPWLRLRPPADIKKEVSLLYNRGIREIWIRADEFNSDLNWTISVCKAIKELNYQDLFFECNLRADKITEELVTSMRDINIWMINLGIETFNQRVLDGIQKHVTIEQIINACKMLKKHNIDIYAWLMYYQIWEDNGKLCWETPQEVDNTLKMAKKLQKDGLIDLMSWQIATPIPGSQMFDIAKKYKLIKEPYQINVWKIGTMIPGIKEYQLEIHRLKGLLLQAYIAYKKGRVGWRTRTNIMGRLKYITDSIWQIAKSFFFKRSKN